MELLVREVWDQVQGKSHRWMRLEQRYNSDFMKVRATLTKLMRINVTFVSDYDQLTPPATLNLAEGAIGNRETFLSTSCLLWRFHCRFLLWA